jgi:hypothetical protein
MRRLSVKIKQAKAKRTLTKRQWAVCVSLSFILRLCALLFHYYSNDKSFLGSSVYIIWEHFRSIRRAVIIIPMQQRADPPVMIKDFIKAASQRRQLIFSEFPGGAKWGLAGARLQINYARAKIICIKSTASGAGKKRRRALTRVEFKGRILCRHVTVNTPGLLLAKVSRRRAPTRGRVTHLSASHHISGVKYGNFKSRWSDNNTHPLSPSCCAAVCE